VELNVFCLLEFISIKQYNNTTVKPSMSHTFHHIQYLQKPFT